MKLADMPSCLGGEDKCDKQEIVDWPPIIWYLICFLAKYLVVVRIHPLQLICAYPFWYVYTQYDTIISPKFQEGIYQLKPCLSNISVIREIILFEFPVIILHSKNSTWDCINTKSSASSSAFSCVNPCKSSIFIILLF